MRLELSGGKVGAARSPLRRHAGTCHRKRVMSRHGEDKTNQGYWQSQTLLFLTYISVTHPTEAIWDASV